MRFNQKTGINPPKADKPENINTKHQIPNKSQIANSKRGEAIGSEFLFLVIGICLVFGIYISSGEFGIFAVDRTIFYKRSHIGLKANDHDQ